MLLYATICYYMLLYVSIVHYRYYSSPKFLGPSFWCLWDKLKDINRRICNVIVGWQSSCYGYYGLLMFAHPSGLPMAGAQWLRCGQMASRWSWWWCSEDLWDGLQTGSFGHPCADLQKREEWVCVPRSFESSFVTHHSAVLRWQGHPSLLCDQACMRNGGQVPTTGRLRARSGMVGSSSSVVVERESHVLDGFDFEKPRTKWPGISSCRPQCDRSTDCGTAVPSIRHCGALLHSDFGFGREPPCTAGDCERHHCLQGSWLGGVWWVGDVANHGPCRETAVWPSGCCGDHDRDRQRGSVAADHGRSATGKQAAWKLDRGIACWSGSSDNTKHSEPLHLVEKYFLSSAMCKRSRSLCNSVSSFHQRCPSFALKWRARSGAVSPCP